MAEDEQDHEDGEDDKVDLDRRQKTEEQEPEPEEQEDLLIESVDAEDTESVEGLEAATGPEHEEVTLGHLGEDLHSWAGTGGQAGRSTDPAERVCPLVFLPGQPAHRLYTVLEERSTQEPGDTAYTVLHGQEVRGRGQGAGSRR